MSKYVLVTDIAQLPGSLTIGDDPASDTLTVNALLASDVVPDGTGTRILGNPGARWDMFGNRLYVEDLRGPASHDVANTIVGYTLTGIGPTPDTIEVFTFDGLLYRGGTMTVYVEDNAAAGAKTVGTAEYTFINDPSDLTGADITFIRSSKPMPLIPKGQPISGNCVAANPAGSNITLAIENDPAVIDATSTFKDLTITAYVKLLPA